MISSNNNKGKQMSINNRNDDVQINKEGTMVSVSTIQQSNESFNKINIEDGIKQQLGKWCWWIFIESDRIFEYFGSP